MYVSQEFSQFFTVTDGKFPIRYPSVTKILGALQDKTFLEEWKARVGEEEAARISKEASEFGDALHNRIERYLMGEELEELKAGRLSFTFQSLLGKLSKKTIDVVGIEVPMQSSIMKLQGRCDCIAFVDGVLTIIDWKTSKQPRIKTWNEVYFIQAAAYALCFKEMTGITPKRLAIVICGELFCQWESEDLVDWVKKLKSKIDEYYIKYSHTNSLVIE